MKLRWELRETSHGAPEIKAHLQVWVQNPRATECAGLDYSEDGVWADVPTVLEVRAESSDKAVG